MAGIARLALLNSARYFKRPVSHTRSLLINMSYFTATRRVLPDGVFPTMITPMNEDKSVDWAGVDSEFNNRLYLNIAIVIRAQ